jgi:hypothetical protein
MFSIGAKRYVMAWDAWAGDPDVYISIIESENDRPERKSMSEYRPMLPWAFNKRVHTPHPQAANPQTRNRDC